MYRVSDHHQMLQCQPRPSLDMDRLCWGSNTSSSKVVAPNCPRCASSNTKFCYYNNYSLSQPRYFCKACRRYWTRGGSLRNVPVGGGCRKSRRAKSARHQPTTARSLSPDFPTSEPSSSGSPNRPTGTDIDVAAVFANFLNQDSGTSSTEFVGNGSELADESNPFLDFTQHGGDQFIVGIPQIGQQEEQIGEFVMGNDPNCLGLENMLGDELLPQDLVWSDDSNPPTLPNFGWEQMGQFQELGQVLSASDDHSKVSPNLISDNWNLFDLSSYEIFSRP